MRFKVSDINLKNQFFPLEGQEFVQQLADVIKKKRLEKQIRQSDLANAVFSSLSTIKRIEKGDTTVEFGVIIKVLWYLNLLSDLQLALPKSASPSSQATRRVRLSQTDAEDF